MQVPVVRRSVPWRSWAARRCLRMGCVGEWASGQVVDLAGSGGSEELPSARAHGSQRSGITSGRFGKQSGPTHLPRARFTPRAGVPPPAPSLLVAAECAVQRGGSARSSYTYSSHLVRCSHITASSLSPRTARARAHTHTHTNPPTHTFTAVPQLCSPAPRRTSTARHAPRTHFASHLVHIACSYAWPSNPPSLHSTASLP